MKLVRLREERESQREECKLSPALPNRCSGRDRERRPSVEPSAPPCNSNSHSRSYSSAGPISCGALWSCGECSCDRVWACVHVSVVYVLAAAIAAHGLFGQSATILPLNHTCLSLYQALTNKAKA
jgi:hypothetical protein